jgi:hypothetical protein
MVYQDTESIDGVTVYKFVQTIKPTPSAAPQQLPASLLGLPGSGDVKSQAYYSNVRTVWVEPETGVIIKGQEQQYNTIRAEGQDRLITTKATITYSDASVKMLADTYGSKGDRLHLIRVVLPIIALIAGVVLVLVGLFVTHYLGRHREGGAPSEAEPQEPASEESAPSEV